MCCHIQDSMTKVSYINGPNECATNFSVLDHNREIATEMFVYILFLLWTYFLQKYLTISCEYVLAFDLSTVSIFWFPKIRHVFTTPMTQYQFFLSEF